VRPDLAHHHGFATEATRAPWLWFALRRSPEDTRWSAPASLEAAISANHRAVMTLHPSQESSLQDSRGDPDATFIGSGAPVSGLGAIEAMFHETVIVYADGTPRTKHVVTSIIIDLEEERAPPPHARTSPSCRRARRSAADHRGRPLPRPLRAARRALALHRAARAHRPSRRRQPAPAPGRGGLTSGRSLRTSADVAEGQALEETRESSTGGQTLVRRVPLGVVAAVVPWNF
jgi:hypothetical protein